MHGQMMLSCAHFNTSIEASDDLQKTPIALWAPMYDCKQDFPHVRIAFETPGQVSRWAGMSARISLAFQTACVRRLGGVVVDFEAVASTFGLQAPNLISRTRIREGLKK